MYVYMYSIISSTAAGSTHQSSSVRRLRARSTISKYVASLPS